MRFARRSVLDREQAIDRAQAQDLTSFGEHISVWSTDEFDRRLRVADGFLADRALAKRIAPYLSPGRTLNRADVFAASGALPVPIISAEGAGAFLAVVNSWGFNIRGYGASRTTKVLAEYNFAASALHAIELVRSGDPVEAYHFLLNRSRLDVLDGGHVRGWGPAFFTKFLYFADPENQPLTTPTRTTALILDQVMSRVIDRLLPAHPVGRYGGKAYWSTAQYAFYVTLLRRLATEFSNDSLVLTPGLVEANLFGANYADRR